LAVLCEGIEDKMKDAKARLRRKKVYSFLDVGRLKPEEGVVIVEPEPTTLQGFLRREEQRKRKEALEAQRVKDAAIRAEYDRRLAAFWSRPVTELVGRLGMRDDYCPLETVASEATASKDFLDELTASGTVLTADAKNRIAAYCDTQNIHSHNQIGVTVANLRLALARLKQLGCFAVGEVTEPEPVAATPQGPTLAELVARANNSTAADRELRSTIAGMFNAEVREVIEAWLHNIHDNYGVSLNENQIREAWAYIQARNLPALAKSSWDIARRHLVSICLLSDACLTCREVLERQYRDGVINHREFLQRCRTLEIEGVLDKPRSQASSS
jgi:hypothetical protein